MRTSSLRLHEPDCLEGGACRLSHEATSRLGRPTGHRHLSCGTALAAGLLLLGCEDSVTAVVVEIDADPQIVAETTSLDLEVRGGPSSGVLERRIAQTIERPLLHWPFYVAIGPSDGDATRRFDVTASAHTATGTSIGRVRALCGFIKGRTLALRLVLETACRDVAAGCGETQTCVGGTCTNQEIDPSTLSDYRGRADGGAGVVDAARGDASLDARTSVDGGGCRFSTECDDTNACTEDRCESLTCVHFNETAPGVVCDDLNPCTTGDTCVAGTGTCMGDAMCDDEDACTHTDLCTAAGVCAGVAYGCPSGSAGSVPAVCDGAGGCFCSPVAHLCDTSAGDPVSGCYPACCPGAPDRFKCAGGCGQHHCDGSGVWTCLASC